jgi:hypothetical protein
VTIRFLRHPVSGDVKIIRVPSYSTTAATDR